MQKMIVDLQLNSMRLAGKKWGAERSGDRTIAVLNPFTEEVLGTVPKITKQELIDLFAKTKAYQANLTRFERANILNKAAAIVRERVDTISKVISAEAGLCLKDSIYEVGRVADVLQFGANEVLKDDGQIFSCDLTPHGKNRKVYTHRSPLLGVI
jgi:acyl-CoA reductase-like NAD-dependent aldehyde dehydrogenase